jgi:hypothetical protein
MKLSVICADDDDSRTVGYRGGRAKTGKSRSIVVGRGKTDVDGIGMKDVAQL